MILPPEFLTRPFAHRALHDLSNGRPENSRAAVRAAIESGYGIEMDLQGSADDQAMVFHDRTLERLTARSGPLRTHSAKELGRITLTGGDEGIPTLAEVLDIVAGQVPLLIEVKDHDGTMGPNVGPLEQATAAALRGYAGPVAVMSFNPHSVAALARLMPDVPRGLTTCSYPARNWPTVPEATRARLRDIPDFDRVGAAFISHDIRDLGAPAVAVQKAKGTPILCWTVTSPEQEAKARIVADNITFEGYLA